MYRAIKIISAIVLTAAIIMCVLIPCMYEVSSISLGTAVIGEVASALIWIAMYWVYKESHQMILRERYSYILHLDKVILNDRKFQEELKNAPTECESV